MAENVNNYIRYRFILNNFNNELICHSFLSHWNSTKRQTESQVKEFSQKDFILGPGKKLYKKSQRNQKEFIKKSSLVRVAQKFNKVVDFFTQAIC